MAELLDILDALCVPNDYIRRQDGEFTWRGRKYKYIAYIITPVSGDPTIRIDIKEAK